MKALISGGAGFVGTNLAARFLSYGHEVVIMDDMTRKGCYDNIDWLRSQYGAKFTLIPADVRLISDFFSGVIEAAHPFDAIFHLAAQTAVTTSLENPEHDFQVNAIGTLRVLEYARRQKQPPVVLFTSTNKVYGDLRDFDMVEKETRYFAHRYWGVEEQDQPLRPITPYGCSKACADQYCQDYARIYRVPTIVFRMSCIYGPHQHGCEDQGWIDHMVRTAIAGGAMHVYGNGKQVRDALYVEDLVDAMLLAIKYRAIAAGRVFNIGGGCDNTISVLELIDWCRRELGVKPQVSFHPERPGDQKWYVSDIRRAQEALCWKPKVSVEDGLNRMVKSWVSAGPAQVK